MKVMKVHELESGMAIIYEGRIVQVAVAAPYEGGYGIWTPDVEPDSEPIMMFPFNAEVSIAGIYPQSARVEDHINHYFNDVNQAPWFIREMLSHLRAIEHEGDAKDINPNMTPELLADSYIDLITTYIGEL